MEELEKARNARSRSSVLKAKLLTVRSGEPIRPIIVFEGRKDIGPYEAWIGRIDGGFEYHSLPAAGKDQVLEFWRVSVSDTRFKSTYFIVDRDFDGMRGHEPDCRIFCTRRYSYENYLVEQICLRSILVDEFELSDEPAVAAHVLGVYSRLLQAFLEAMTDVNIRLVALVLAGVKVRRPGKEERINRYVDISTNAVTRRYDEASLQLLVPTEREPTADERLAAVEHLRKLGDPKCAYRGKYLLSFFLRWVELLAEERRLGQGLFVRPRNIKLGMTALTDRNLASRAQVPEGLKEFVHAIRGHEERRPPILSLIEKIWRTVMGVSKTR